MQSSKIFEEFEVRGQGLGNRGQRQLDKDLQISPRGQGLSSRTTTLENEAFHTAVLAPKASTPAYNLYTEGNAVVMGSRSSHSSGTELILFPSISPRMNFRATSHSLQNPESLVLT